MTKEKGANAVLILKEEIGKDKRRRKGMQRVLLDKRSLVKAGHLDNIQLHHANGLDSKSRNSVEKERRTVGKEKEREDTPARQMFSLDKRSLLR